MYLCIGEFNKIKINSTTLEISKLYFKLINIFSLFKQFQIKISIDFYAAKKILKEWDSNPKFVSITHRDDSINYYIKILFILILSYNS